MFTRRSVSFPGVLHKYPGSPSGLNQDLWPFSATPQVPSVSTETKLNDLEKGGQLRVLSPLLSYIAASGNPQYHNIVALFSQKTEKIIEQASNTLVLIGDQRISILAILADSVNPLGHWSVEGHQAIDGLKRFTQEQLTVTKLQKL